LGTTGITLQERLGLGEKRKCKKRKPKRKKKDSKKCRASEFGCCWDGFSVAKGPFGEGKAPNDNILSQMYVFSSHLSA